MTLNEKDVPDLFAHKLAEKKLPPRYAKLVREAYLESHTNPYEKGLERAMEIAEAVWNSGREPSSESFVKGYNRACKNIIDDLCSELEPEEPEDDMTDKSEEAPVPPGMGNHCPECGYFYATSCACKQSPEDDMTEKETGKHAVSKDDALKALEEIRADQDTDTWHPNCYLTLRSYIDSQPVNPYQKGLERAVEIVSTFKSESVLVQIVEQRNQFVDKILDALRSELEPEKEIEPTLEDARNALDSVGIRLRTEGSGMLPKRELHTIRRYLDNQTEDL